MAKKSFSESPDDRRCFFVFVDPLDIEESCLPPSRLELLLSAESSLCDLDILDELFSSSRNAFEVFLRDRNFE